MEEPFSKQSWQLCIFNERDLVDAFCFIVGPSNQVCVDVFEVGQADLELEVFGFGTFRELKLLGDLSEVGRLILSVSNF